MSSTLVSWALTLSLLGVAVLYYKPDLVSSLKQSPSTTQPSQPQSEPSERPANKRNKSKKSQVAKLASPSDESAPSSSQETKSSKKRKIIASTGGDTNVQAADTTTLAGTASARKDVDLADKEFAQQLAKTQAGTNLQKPEGQKSAKKSRALKQAQVTNLESSGVSTETSSTTGRDADDDLTPGDSPVLNPKQGPSTAGDVSDMMEAPTANPTVLRLSNIPDQSKSKKKAAAQPFEQVLTKKQRQAQAKKEELRLMKEESDRIHEAKKQEQLRKARMASGTSNQTRANNFASSTSNAWQSGKNSATVKAAPVDNTVPLLDTFEPSMNNVSHPHGAVHTVQSRELRPEMGSAKNGALAASERESQNYKDVAFSGNISEEDQMKMLKEQQAEDAWESVMSKKLKKKTKNDTEETPAVHYQTSTHPRSQVNGTKSAGSSSQKEPETNNRFGSFQVSQSDSFGDAEWEA